MSRENIKLISINLLFALVVGILYVFISDRVVAQKAQQIAYIIITIFSLKYLKSVYGSIVNIHSIFILFIILFGGSRIILDLFDYADMMEEFWFTGNPIPYDVNLRCILNMNLATSFYTIGAILGYKNSSSTISKRALRINVSNVTLYSILIIGMIVKISYSYMSFTQIVLTGRYLDMYNGEIVINYPYSMKFIAALPMFSLFVLMSRKKNYLHIAIFIIYALLDMATGQRGYTILTFVIMYYYLLKKEYIKFNIVKIASIAVAFMILFTAIGNIRKGEIYEETDSLEFFWSQGISLGVLQQTIELKDELEYSILNLWDNVWMLFVQLTDSAMYTKEELRSVLFKPWSAYISYMTNASLVARGNGLGGNHIGQLFAIGGEFAVSIGSILLAQLIAFFDRRLLSSNLFSTFIAFVCLKSLLYIPRDNIFDFIVDSIYYLAIPFILCYMSKQTNRTNTKLKTY